MCASVNGVQIPHGMVSSLLHCSDSSIAEIVAQHGKPELFVLDILSTSEGQLFTGSLNGINCHRVL